MRRLMRRLVLSVLCVSLFYSTASVAINKCVDDKGRVSFQDKPCVATSTATAVKQQPISIVQSSDNGVKIVDLKVGSGKHFSIGLPSDWKVSVKTPPGIVAPTLRAQPPSGSDLVLLMSFIPNPNTFVNGSSLLQKVMSEIDRQHQGNPNEKSISSLKIKQVFGKAPGKLNTYLDRRLANKSRLSKGEFMLVSEGAVVIDGVVVKITILTNDVASLNYKKAFAGIHAIIGKKA